MKDLNFYIYWNFGSCEDGSHNSGMRRFEAEKFAEECIEWLRRIHKDETGEIVMIRGEVVREISL